MDKPIILLDLNFTLVGNSLDKRKQGGNYAQKIDAELYRLWLVDLLRPYTVLLCTVRHQRFQAQTLARIASQTGGWQPHESHFNPLDDYRGYVVKKLYLEESIFAQYGKPDVTPYFAIESSADTRAMYKRFGIPARPVKDEVWTALPYPPS